MTACGASARVTLPAGGSLVDAPAGSVMRPDHLLLDSPAPSAPTAPPFAATVSTLDVNGTGLVKRVRLNHMTGPAWMVLGQSFADGERARCRTAGGAQRDLGEPVMIDGYANGWRVGGDCREVSFSFRPQRVANASYVLSAIGILAMAAVFLLGTLPGRRRSDVPARTDGRRRRGRLAILDIDDPVRRPGVLRSVPIAAAVGGVAAACFALRMGVVLGPAALLLLLVGVNARRLLALASLILLAIPIVYVAHPAPRFVNYAQHHITGHWLAVAAVWCLAAACLLAGFAARARSSS